jgi:methionyl-tRNA synthetase
MTGKPAYYITTPIYYVNDVPHIGHAYTTLACDVLARFKRLDGYDVMFLTGTDEHGQKVEKSAEAAGIDPLSFCDRVSEHFRDLAKAMNFSNDDFIRTTEARHKKACQALWQKLEASGDIYPGTYDGWYSVRDEAFYAEAELTTGAGGEKVAPTGAPVEWVKESSYFFRLSAWGDKLLEHYQKHPDAVLPKSRMNEVTSFIKSGLRDLSVSRTSFKWGIAVPGDSDHIMYVWIDALTNYISALGYPDTDSQKFKKFWPADVHMIGKDILRFHAVYWPVFLMAAGLPPPQRVFAHGWWTNEGQKISKSVGNVIDPFEIIETYGLDPIRYFLMREVPFGQDGDFSRLSVVNRINSDLANDLGNLAQRSLSMIARNCDGRLPEPGAFTDEDQVTLAETDRLADRMRLHMDAQEIHLALEAIWRLVAHTNSYFAAAAPWALKKTDPARMGTVLYVTAEVIRNVALLTLAVMPTAAATLLEQLGQAPNQMRFSELGAAGRLKPGILLPPPQGVFPRIVEEV